MNKPQPLRNLSELDAPAAIDPADPAHLELLRLLEQHPDYSQRQLAVALRVSLGKTHYLLKALLGKGWVKAQNFQRSDRKLGYLYILTPTGVKHRFQLTQAFLARKERDYECLQSQIVLLRAELAAQAKSLSGISQSPIAETVN